MLVEEAIADLMLAQADVFYRPKDDSIDMAITALKSQKAGYWEWVQYDYNPNIGNWHCSECKNIAVVGVNKNEKGGIPIYKYCPNCGAKMVDPQESEKIDCKSTN